MKIVYISPSTLPSRTANSIHVVMQCAGLVNAGAEVKLFAKRSVCDEHDLETELEKAYGREVLTFDLKTYYSKTSKADSLKIAFVSLTNIFRNPWPDCILSRNLYAAFIIGVLMKRKIIFETHQLEYGFRKKMQFMIMRSSKVTTITISQKLVECLEEHHGKGPLNSLVLHDAAPDGIQPLAIEKRRASIARIVQNANNNWEAVCGYFGHLYEGRGIEVIDGLAKCRPDALFLVFGGNESDIEERKRNNQLKNVVYAGHLPYPEAQEAMRSVDVLLMPYQRTVSIGVAQHDTARWMSPMKMFEYLASGVPIISSDLPVLREVLKDKVNCLLVDPENVDDWLNALGSLIENPDFSANLGKQGHIDYSSEHTWYQRGKRIIDSCVQVNRVE